MIAFGEDYALGIFFGAVQYRADHVLTAALKPFQLFNVLAEIGDGRFCHARLHGGLGNGRCDPQQHPRIERLGNDVFGTKLEFLPRISL